MVVATQWNDPGTSWDLYWIYGMKPQLMGIKLKYQHVFKQIYGYKVRMSTNRIYGINPSIFTSSLGMSANILWRFCPGLSWMIWMISSSKALRKLMAMSTANGNATSEGHVDGIGVFFVEGTVCSNDVGILNS